MSDRGVEVLAIAAHRDDVELTCGGTLVRCVEQGYRTGVIDLTEGEMGTRGSATLRAEEAARAADVLGLAVRMNAGLPDAGLFNNQENRERLAFGLEARHHVSIPIDQILLKIPLDGAADRLGEGRQVRVYRMCIGAEHADLGEHRELDAVVRLAESSDLAVVAGFLLAEVVGRKAEHVELVFAVALVEGLQAGVLRGVAALTGRVDDEEHLAAVVRERFLRTCEASSAEVEQFFRGLLCDCTVGRELGADGQSEDRGHECKGSRGGIAHIPAVEPVPMPSTVSLSSLGRI